MKRKSACLLVFMACCICCIWLLGEVACAQSTETTEIPYGTNETGTFVTNGGYILIEDIYLKNAEKKIVCSVNNPCYIPIFELIQKYPGKFLTFKPSYGCTQLGCADPFHVHICPVSCNDTGHNHK